MKKIPSPPGEMPEAKRLRQLEHIRAAIAECDRQHTPEQIAAAEARLEPWRTRVKARVMGAYHRRRIPSCLVKIAFRVLGLRSA
jgi:hypothetical protein